MTYLSAVGVTVGLLAGIWVYCSSFFGIMSFVGFLGWATYYAAGGKFNGALKATCSNISGVFWGFVVVGLIGILPAYAKFFVIIAAAAIMCWQAKFGFLSFIPGTFIGNACFYANGNNWFLTSVGLICGVLLGILSDYPAQWIAKVKKEKNR